MKLFWLLAADEGHWIAAAISTVGLIITTVLAGVLQRRNADIARVEDAVRACTKQVNVLAQALIVRAFQQAVTEDQRRACTELMRGMEDAKE